MVLAGKTAVVSGGARGIGAAAAWAIAKAGAKVAICSRKSQELQDTGQKIHNEVGVEPLVSIVDVTDPLEVDQFSRTVLDTFGCPDFLINNAGGWTGGDLTTVATAEIIRMVNVNITGTLLMTKAFLPAMYERGTGHIVNIASVSAIQSGYPDTALYVTCKKALDGFGQALSREARSHGVKVTTLYPNSVASRFDYDPPLDFLRSDKGYTKLSLRNIVDAILFAISQPANAVVEQIVVTSLARKDF
jgi:NADP-dependent 3-hydroxy acid dehydrogenase YdfG